MMLERPYIAGIRQDFDQQTGRTTLFYAWFGPQDGTASLGYLLIPASQQRCNPGDLIHLNGVTVQVISRDGYSPRLLVRLPRWTWRYHAATTEIKRRLAWVNDRLKITCQVWGLMPYGIGQEPRWRDLFPRSASKERT